MSEEEKKAIEILSSWYNYNKKNRNKLLEADKIIKVQETILNLIENQQKEIENLKEIEKSHKEENGKLRVELEQEKEKNKELEKSDRSKEQSSMSYYNKLRDLKNKIIAKLEELEYGDGYFTFLEERDLELTIKILKQLLEEK